MAADQIEYKPKVNIGIPVHNGELYLEETVSSVLKQTYQNLSIIISDNNSSDNTIELVKRFKSEKIKLIHTNNLVSIGDNFENVYANRDSDAEYFMWLGADDIIPEKMIETLVQKCVRTKSLCCPTVQHINGDGHHISHIANNRCFSLNMRYALMRRIYFFIIPEYYGKGNIFLGLWPVSGLAEYVISSLPLL